MRHLVVVVPGMGGSVLADSAGVVWGDRFGRLMGVVSKPGRLTGDRPLRVTGLTNTMGYLAPLNIPGYDGLVRGLLSCFGSDRVVVDVAADGAPRNLGADVVLFPYDFRLGVEPAARRLAAEVSARLAHLPARDQVGRVIVVGHSMGGLVARCWAMMEVVQAHACAAIVTVGTPHRGATKALEWLVNGVRVGSGVTASVSRPVLTGSTEMVRSWPGMYDLLPTYRVVDDPAHGRRLTAYELAQAGGPDFAADPFFYRQARRAQNLHDALTAAFAAPGWVPGMGPITIPFMARDHGTAHAAMLVDGGLEVTATDPGWQPNPGWRGDGTVPALSAIPPEMAGPAFIDRWHHATERHGPMAGASSVVQLLCSLVGSDVSAVRGGPAEGLRLGVDLDDAAVVGEPVSVAVRLGDRRGVADASGMRVFVSVQPDDDSLEPTRIEAVRVAGGEWRAVFAPALVGMWRVRVQTVNPTGDEPRTVTDTMAVLPPDRGETDGRLSGSGSW